MSSTEKEEPENPFAGWRFRSAAVFLALVVVAAVVLIVFPRSGTDGVLGVDTSAPSTPLISSSSTAAPSSDTTSTQASDGSVGTESVAVTQSTAVGRTAGSPALAPEGTSILVDLAPSVCGLDPGDQEVPTMTPLGTEWQMIGGRVAAPTSAAHGPGTISPQGIPNCFAHSPTGALYAMANSVALTTIRGGSIPQTEIVQQRGSRTELYDVALAEAIAEDDRGAGFPDEAPQQVTILGFRVIDYTPQRATIALAFGVGDPLQTSTYQPMMMTGVMSWEDGDWKWVYSLQTAGSMAPIVSTQQYIAWAA